MTAENDLRFIDEGGPEIGQEIMPRTDAEVRSTMLFSNPFVHSELAFLRSCFMATRGYRPD